METCENIQKLVLDLLSESEFSEFKKNPHFLDCATCQSCFDDHRSLLDLLKNADTEYFLPDEGFFEAQRYSVLAQIKESSGLEYEELFFARQRKSILSQVKRSKRPKYYESILAVAAILLLALLLNFPSKKGVSSWEDQLSLISQSPLFLQSEDMSEWQDEDIDQVYSHLQNEQVERWEINEESIEFDWSDFNDDDLEKVIHFLERKRNT